MCDASDKSCAAQAVAAIRNDTIDCSRCAARGCNAICTACCKACPSCACSLVPSVVSHFLCVVHRQCVSCKSGLHQGALADERGVHRSTVMFMHASSTPQAARPFGHLHHNWHSHKQAACTLQCKKPLPIIAAIGTQCAPVHGRCRMRTLLKAAVQRCVCTLACHQSLLM